MNAFPMNAPDSLIRLLERFGERLPCRGHAENAPAVRNKLSVPQSGSGMVDNSAVNLTVLIQSLDRNTFFIMTS